MPEPEQPIVAMPSTSGIASEVSAAAYSEQDGTLDAASFDAQPGGTRTLPAQERVMSAEIGSPQEHEAQDPAAAAETDAWQQDDAAELATAMAPPPLPLAASSNVAVAGRPQHLALPNVPLQDEHPSHSELYEAAGLTTTATPPLPSPAVCSNVAITSRSQRLTMPRVTAQDQATRHPESYKESELAATAALSPPLPLAPAASSATTVVDRPRRLRMPIATSPDEDASTCSPMIISPRDSCCATDSPSQELQQLNGRGENGGACFPSVEVRPWARAPQAVGIGCSADCPREAETMCKVCDHPGCKRDLNVVSGAAGPVLCEQHSKNVAVRRQRSPTDSKTQSTPPQENGQMAPRRATKKKRRRLTASTPEKNTSPAHVASTPSSRPSNRRDSCWKVRYSHTTVCVSCEKPPLEQEHVGLCRCCPRMFCPGCLRKMGSANASATVVGAVAPGGEVHDGSVELAGVGPPGGRFVELDVSIQKCPFCLRGSDVELPPPPSLPRTEDIVPKTHLIQELLKHNLSHCFRVPVDVKANAGYLNAVNRDNMMDLGTMMHKIRAGKYYGERGSTAFYLDLGRVWDNCRAYAECDKQGKPLVRSDEAAVPGILRCAFLLETMARKFVKKHMPTDELPPQWYVQSWDPSSNPSSNPNPNQHPSQNTSQDPQQNPIANPSLGPISNSSSDLNPNQDPNLDPNPTSNPILNPNLNSASDSNPSPTSNPNSNPKPNRSHDEKS